MAAAALSSPPSLLDIGVQVFPGPPREIVEEAIIAESLGYTSVWVADHYNGGGRDLSWPVPEVIAVLGAIANATSRIHIGSCVMSLQKRDPATVAHAALTLNALSSGRFELGVGTGFGPDLRAFGVDLQHPAGRLAEALQVVRLLFETGPARPVTFNGRWFQLRDAFLNVPNVSPPPLHVASVGLRTLELTKRWADGWLPFGLSPDLYSDFLSVLGPVSSEFVPGLWIPTLIERPGEDRSAEAEAAGRLYLSMAPEILKRVMPDPSKVPTQEATHWTAEHARRAVDSIPTEVALAIPLRGSPEACADTVRAFMRAGCRRLVLRITDARTRSADIEYFGRTVLPHFMVGGD